MLRNLLVALVVVLATCNAFVHQGGFVRRFKTTNLCMTSERFDLTRFGNRFGKLMGAFGVAASLLTVNEPALAAGDYFKKLQSTSPATTKVSKSSKTISPVTQSAEDIKLLESVAKLQKTNVDVKTPATKVKASKMVKKVEVPKSLEAPVAAAIKTKASIAKKVKKVEKATEKAVTAAEKSVEKVSKKTTAMAKSAAKKTSKGVAKVSTEAVKEVKDVAKKTSKAVKKTSKEAAKVSTEAVKEVKDVAKKASKAAQKAVAPVTVASKKDDAVKVKKSVAKAAKKAVAPVTVAAAKKDDGEAAKKTDAVVKKVAKSSIKKTK